jgi:hypothetical protein
MKTSVVITWMDGSYQEHKFDSWFDAVDWVKTKTLEDGKIPMMVSILNDKLVQ